MKIRFRFNHWLPRRLRIGAITLYPFVLFSMEEKSAVVAHVVDHEMVHVEQVRQAGWLRFYGTYVWQYLRGRVRGLNHMDAYFAVPAEIEAFRRQNTDSALFDAYREERGHEATGDHGGTK